MNKQQITKNTYRQRAELTLEAAADLERILYEIINLAQNNTTITPAMRANFTAARTAFLKIKNNAVLILEEPKTL